VHGKVGIAEVDGLGTSSVLALSDRIIGVPREDRDTGSLSITVEKADGRSVTVRAIDPVGSPHKPLTEAQFEAKFRDCASNATRPLPVVQVDAVLATIRTLETILDARDLIAPFA
jgi:2-methylcitrate dehydratase PrpD